MRLLARETAAEAARARPAGRCVASALVLCGWFAAAGPCGGGEAERPQLWFAVGETLTYQIYWGVLPVGQARVWTEWVEEEPGRPLVAIRVTIRTGSVLDKVYPVDDFLETVVDPATFLPLRYTRRVSEGRYRLHEQTTFDHGSLEAHWKHLTKGDTETFAIEADTRDMLSFMYYMRSQPLEPEREYSFKVMADEKVHAIKVRTRKAENINLSSFGWVESLRVEPVKEVGGVLARAVRASMWVSRDARRLCAKASVSVPVASVNAYLKKVEGGADDFWANPGRYRRLKSGELERIEGGEAASDEGGN